MLDIHLKTKVFTHDPGLFVTDTELDIHLKTKVFTQYKLKYNESQLYITKN